MAKKVTLVVEVDSTGAIKGVKQVEKQVTEIGKKAQDVGTKASSSFKEMATNMAKSLGIISLIAGAINMIKDAFMSNQKFADLFNTAFGTLSTMIRDFATFVIDNFGKVVDFFKQVFENPIDSLKAFGQAIVDNLIERFNSLLDTFGYLGEALSKLFSGDFSGAWDSVKKAGKESIDIITGVNNTVDKTVEIVSKAVDSITDYAKATWDANKALVDAQNQAKLAAAQQARLAEQYDREAELLRQRRDDERNSIKERIEANNKLAEVLNKQEKAELSAANAIVRAAQLNYNLNKTIDNQVALTQALATVDGVRAKIAGLRSEQQANDLALNKEYNEMLKSQSEATAELNVNSKKFATELILNELERLKVQRTVLEEESKIQLERLQNQINLYKEGTQARVDAEIAYQQKKQEIDQNIQLKDKEIRDAEISRLNEINQIKLGLITDLFKRERAALELEYAEKYRLAYNDSQKLEALEKEKALKLRGIRQAEIMKYAQMTSDGLGVLMQINDAFDKKDEESARKRFKLNKALGIAQATINTFMAVNAALTAGGNPAKLATGIQFVEAGLALATGIANVIKIQQTKFEAGSTGSAPSGGGNLGSFSQGGGGQPPQGLTAQNTVTQLNPDGSVAGQGERNAAPMKAYVVESESRAVTERVNKLSNNSKIG